MSGRLISGGAMIPAGARKAPKPPRLISGGAMVGARRAPKRKPPRLISGGAMIPAGARKARKPRGLASPGAGGGWVLGGNDVAETCAAAAVANSLLAATGVRAGDEEVAALGASLAIEDALEAASEFGLGGLRPRDFNELGEHAVDLLMPSDVLGFVVDHDGDVAGDGDECAAAPTCPEGQLHGSTLILGVELPGPHTVLALGDSWVTWGQRYPSSAFAGAVVEEAWEVRWAA